MSIKHHLEKDFDLFDNISNDILIVDKDNNILHCNESLRLKLQYTYEELLSLKITEIFCETFATNTILKQNKDAHMMKAHDKSHNKLYFEGKLINGIFNNTKCIYYILNEILYDSSSTSITIKTLIEEIETVRHRSQDKDILLNKAVDLLCIANTNGYFTKVSPELISSLGWAEEELLLEPYIEFVHPDDRHSTLLLEKSLSKGNDIVNSTNRYLCKDGSYKWLSWSSRFVDSQQRIISSVKDITILKDAEEKAKFLEDKIYLEKLRSELFANISHDFKTPLNIILATTQLILKNQTSSTHFEKYMKVIKQNSYRLLRLVNNLVDLTKIDSGFYELNLGNYNIVNIIEDITLSVAQYVEDKGVKLIFDTDIEEKITACDLDKIERVMLNLLSNAIKYTDKGDTIYVFLTDMDNCIRISVKDSGVGIDNSKLNHIFNRFAQGDNCLTRGCEGSGIGLSLVKSIVNLHGGTISARSQVGVGTEFIIDLPINLCDESNMTKDLENSTLINDQIEKCNVEFSDIYSLY